MPSQMKYVRNPTEEYVVMFGYSTALADSDVRHGRSQTYNGYNMSTTGSLIPLTLCILPLGHRLFTEIETSGFFLTIA